MRVLEEIRIAQLGVIESSTLELGPGLTVITGETGAGKTMVVTALGLLLGARADSGAVRSGARAARIEGVVDTTALAGFAQAVDEAGGEIEDGRVVLARNLSAEGRSRAFVGGASVPVSTLAEVTEVLVAVHGQSDQHRLLQQRAQREALDRFGGEPLAALLTTYSDLYQRLRAAERELEEVSSSARERAREADLLRFGLGEVEAVAPTSQEDVELAAEEARLGFADALRAAAEGARESLSGEDGAADALSTTSAARTLLDGVREHDAEAGELADRLAEITYLLSDVAADVASYASRLETDPARLAAVSERRAALTALTRKYGTTIDDVLEWAQASAARLVDLDGTDERIEALRAEQEQLSGEITDAADALTSARREAAGRLATQVTDELALLAMPDAVLEVSLTRTGFTSSGVDEVELLLAANVGSAARPLHKGASGGELSRVMLALEVALAGTSPVPTFVFDEVDAGWVARPRSRSGGVWPSSRARPRFSWSRTCRRWPPTPTGTSSWRSPTTGRSPAPASPSSTTGRGSGSCRGCSPVWPSPTPRWRTPESCSPWPDRREPCREVTGMRFSSRRTTLSTLPGVSGTARVARRAPQLLARLREGDIAVIDHHDLDQETALRLVNKGVVGVVNAASMISGRYANLGPEVLAEAGVVLVDRVGEGLGRGPDNQPIRIDDGVVYVDETAVAHGRVVAMAEIHAEMELARSGLAVQLDTLTHNASEFLRREQDLLLDGRGLPDLRTRLTRRPALVVARFEHAELVPLRRYVSEQDPAILAVGTAADALIDFGWVG